MKKIAYIFSMKKGIAPFIYSELVELEKKEFSFSIFPTKMGTGMKKPKPNWNIIKYNPLITIIKQPIHLIKNPFKYLNLFYESIISNSLINFIIATELKDKISSHDRIHCHFGDDKLFIGYYCKKWLNIPLSVTIHAHELYRNNWKMFKKSLELCDKIVTISEYNKKILLNKFNVPTKKIVVNRMFVDTKEFKQENKIKILIVAFFHQKKGHEYLLKAIKSAKTKNLQVWVAGGFVEGYAGVDVPKLADEIGVSDRVCFFGIQSDNSIKALYNECDIFCLPSVTVKDQESEGIPVSLMEAMSYGKPVISTRHAGIPELVTQEIVEEKNVKQLAKAIDKLALDINERKNQGFSNRKKIIKLYSKNNVNNLVKIFNNNEKVLK